jgi:glycine/D-amino acid oxidase-like deaminating enzyme
MHPPTLRSCCPLWPSANPPPPRYPALTRDLSGDVLVIGAGLAGAMAAYELARAGLKVIVTDRREPARGSTAASTALLTPELDTPLHRLAEQIGEANAARCCRLAQEGIDRTAALCADLPHPCGFERRPSLLVAHDAEAAEMLQRELRARREAGFEVTQLTRAAIEDRYPFTAPAALWTPNNAEVDPFALTHALLDDAFDHGALIHSHSKATAPAGPPPFEVATDAGGVVTCRHIVLAGGYEAADCLPGGARDSLTLTSTYALATTPAPALKGWEDRALICTTARPYLYLRTTPDNRVLIGGGDEQGLTAAERDALIPDKTSSLMARLWHLFPKVRVESAFAWSGFFIESPDSLPYIGRVRDGVYAALCYGANGSAFAPIAARILRELITTGESQDAALFDLSRSSSR